MPPDPPPDSFEAHRDRVEWPLLRLLSEFGQERRGYFLFGLLISLAQRIVSLLPPVILGVAIDAVFVQTSPYALPLLPKAWVPATRMGQLWVSIALIGATFLVSPLLFLLRGLCLDYFSHYMMHSVRVSTYEKLQGLQLSFFDDHDTGELMSVLNNDVSNFETFFDDALGQAVRIFAVLAGISLILFSLNWQLALVTLLTVPLLGGLTLWFMRRAEPIYDAVRDSVGTLNTRLENNISGIELIKTAATESNEVEHVTDASSNYFEASWERIKLVFLYHPGTQFLSNLSFVTTFLVGGIWLVDGPPGPLTGSLTVGTFVTFLFMSQRFTGPLKNISQIIDRYENARASGKRVFGLMDLPVSIEDDPDAVPLEDPSGHVAYDDVTFGYGEGDPVLEELTFQAEPGDTVAFVGPTGAGKSTVLKLLLRLYDVNDGAIRVDGTDVRSYTLASLRSAIGYVSQETFLFGGSIEDNISYGALDSDHEAVVEAARAAEAHEFITRLPDGYDTQVGERGVKLSGGQRQRISIARTVLQKPEILVFDEATSAVDTETEMLIQRSLDRLSDDRTTFVIAHRLSTIRDADTILVLEDGEVVERNSHEELLDANGLYASLWSVQAGEIESLPEEFVDRATERTARR